MAQSRRALKITLIVLLVLGITVLHYSTQLGRHHQHILYRELYYLPIILAAFWFGLRGGLAASLSITALYVPFVIQNWQGFSPDDFHQIAELLLNNAIGVILGALRDLDYQKQRKLREMECFAAMGKGISSVAHDMRTPLIAIGGFSLQVRRGLNQSDPACAKLDIIIRETRRMEDMMKDMLDFAKPPNLSLSPASLNDLIVETLALLDGRAQEGGIVFKVELDEDLPRLLLDTQRMRRVLANLIMNALEASPKGAIVTVRSSRAKNAVHLDVSDCGPGIPGDHEKEVFTPFFTTKQHGTGLGLPIARKIAEAHHGKLEVMNNNDGGATFRLILPAGGTAINLPAQPSLKDRWR